jgi:hypothetical protein
VTVDKIEVTEEDIVVILNTIWTRADAIPCEPDTRVSFHAVLLLAAIGGFRPTALMRIPYRQMHLAVVRDPEDRMKTRIVATIAIKIVKKKRSLRQPKDDM